MPRKSKWDGNDEMWEWVAALHRGGVSYADIHARLSTKEKARFALEEVPSPDTLRYQTKRRGLLTNSEPSPLPPEELAEHRRGLSFLGVLLREGVQGPPSVDLSSLQAIEPDTPRFWDGGFTYEAPESVVALSEVEVETKQEWDSFVQGMPSYKFLEQHLRSTPAPEGKRILRDLNKVHRLAKNYDAAVRRMESRAYSEKKKSTGNYEEPSPTLKARRESDEKVLRDNVSAQFAVNVLRHSLRPTALVRRLVQDGYCDICS